MLTTIGAAGKGIRLTATRTVHLVEPYRSPMAEAQAVDRVHRIGELRDVTVVHYVVKKFENLVVTARATPCGDRFLCYLIAYCLTSPHHVIMVVFSPLPRHRAASALSS